jgi:RNA polymerase sigma-70 factor (ECF subfamily)
MNETQTFDPLAAFESERGRLFGIAYRMLGSVSEAEDVLQDAWLRWHAVDPATVESPSGFLVRMVTRLCIDTLGAARNRLTDYVGPWLPEPIVRTIGDPSAFDPAVQSEQADDLSMAFLLLLERLSPVERAVFLLRESFDFSRPGVLTYFEGHLVNVVSLRVEDGKIQNLYIMVNPDKLPRL